jgi:hypothetical protein
MKKVIYNKITKVYVRTVREGAVFIKMLDTDLSYARIFHNQKEIDDYMIFNCLRECNGWKAIPYERNLENWVIYNHKRNIYLTELNGNSWYIEDALEFRTKDKADKLLNSEDFVNRVEWEAIQFKDIKEWKFKTPKAPRPKDIFFERYQIVIDDLFESITKNLNKREVKIDELMIKQYNPWIKNLSDNLRSDIRKLLSGSEI